LIVLVMQLSMAGICFEQDRVFVEVAVWCLLFARRYHRAQLLKNMSTATLDDGDFMLRLWLLPRMDLVYSFNVEKVRNRLSISQLEKMDALPHTGPCCYR
jgi:hypothetical protein